MHPPPEFGQRAVVEFEKSAHDPILPPYPPPHPTGRAAFEEPPPDRAPGGGPGRRVIGRSDYPSVMTTSPSRTSAEAGTSDAGRLTEVITRLRRALRTSIRTDYPWESLPMAHVELMQALGDLPDGARVGELAQTLRLAQNTVSGLVQQLFEKEFVDRRPDPADRRAVRITLAPAGRAQLDSWIAAHERRIAQALGRLSAEDRDVLGRAVEPLAHLVDELN